MLSLLSPQFRTMGSGGPVGITPYRGVLKPISFLIRGNCSRTVCTTRFGSSTNWASMRANPFVTFSLPLFHSGKSFVTPALPFIRLALKREPFLIVTRNLLNERGLSANQQGHCFLKMDTRVGTVSRRHVP